MRTYDVFISHAWKYNKEYYRLESMLESYPYFRFRNYSVPEHDPLSFDCVKDLVNQLDEQIRQSSVILVVGGMYCQYRKWIQKEIEIAKKYDKPILLVQPWGSNKIPSIVETSATKIVGWNSASIVQAIKELSN